MKTIYCILFGLLGLLGGCKQQVKIDTQTDKYVDQTQKWNINVEKAYFSSANAEAEKGCEAVNAKVQSLIDSLQQNIKVQADTFFATFGRDTMDRPLFPYELYVRDTVFLANEDYISIRLSAYSFTGGAHGMTDFYALNYNMKKHAFVSPQEMLDFRQAREINNLLAENFKNEGGCFTEKPTLTNGFTAVNITPESICFTYPQYVLGPYSCGYAQVYIPRDKLNGILVNEKK
ncbi:DUF4163 domain-containing protein [uncultured Odoribacter sp.]|uniref:PdaC/SigV domain-containing protein n=1 Tax=uncultured Odoribacter sp. TaxID=876416 RepID=UPI0026030592|nr:DUF4163 domain-containing protein [uncultured Odoribacter sp.]